MKIRNPQYLLAFVLLEIIFTSQVFATSRVTADSDTSRSLLLNAAQYDTAPIKKHIKYERYIELDSTFTFLPKRRDDVMGKGAENGPKRIILPQVSLNQKMPQGRFDMGVSAWAGYLSLDKVPVGKLKNYHVLHWLAGLSTQLEHSHGSFKYFYPLSYQYTEGGIKGGFIEESLESESSFSCYQVGVGVGVYHSPTKIEGLLQGFRREMSASMQFDTNGVLINAKELEDYRYAFQAAFSYSFMNDWVVNYAQFYIPGRLLLPRIGVSWVKAI